MANRALADGEGLISEKFYIGSEARASLELRWCVRSDRLNSGYPYSESGYSIELGLERNDSVWLRAGRGVTKKRIIRMIGAGKST